MLLEFRAKNYKTFYDELVLSMVPAYRQTGLDYSVLKARIRGVKSPYKALCSSVIYGANASGKTNVIGAVDTMRAIVLRGHIRNSDGATGASLASSKLELVPNVNDRKSANVDFTISFIDGDMKVDYSISLEISGVLHFDSQRRVSSEVLSVNGTVVYERHEHVKFGDHWISSPNGELLGILNKNLNADELFLTNGFRTAVDKKLAQRVIGWFANKLITLMSANAVLSFRKIEDGDTKFLPEPRLSEVAQQLSGSQLKLVWQKSNNDIPRLHTLLPYPQGDGTLYPSVAADTSEPVFMSVPADAFESYGTLRFLDLFPMIMTALETGGTLLIDEFDASLHPFTLMSVVNLFHDDEVNINKAQLIFNTHNVALMSANLFRRDEIKIVERDSDSHNSSIYALSDFGTSGKSGVRKNEDFERNYLSNMYGGIDFVDFSELVKKQLKTEEATNS